MKKIILVLIFVLTSISSFAQQDDKQERNNKDKEYRKEQIETYRIAYLTEKLGITVEQSKEFWPLYEQYRKSMHEVYTKRHDLHKKIEKNEAELSDINDWFDIEIRVSEVARSYVPKFMEVLSADQTAKLFVSEEGFKQELVRWIRRGGGDI